MKKQYIDESDGIEKIADPEIGYTVFLLEDTVAKGYYGKAKKARFYFRFVSKAQRDEYINKWIANLENWARLKKKDREERKAPHTLKVGDILHCFWGYSMCLNDYWQVVEVPTAHSVLVRQIDNSIIWDAHQIGSSMPVKDAFIGAPEMHRVQNNAIAVDPNEASQRQRAIELGYESRYKPDRHYSAKLWDGRAHTEDHND